MIDDDDASKLYCHNKIRISKKQGRDTSLGAAKKYTMESNK